MTITDVIVTPIAFSDPPLLNAAGLHAPFVLRLIIEIKTDEHITGVGEIVGGSKVLVAMEEVHDILIGMDPYERSRIKQAIDTHFSANTEIPYRGFKPKSVAGKMYSAINVALLDIIGKAMERPVCDILGGRVRDRVDFAGYLFYKYEGAGGHWGFGGHDLEATGWQKEKESEFLTPEQIVEEARCMLREFGFKSLKLKGGVFPPETEYQTIVALKKAFPSVPLRIDPNGCWKLDTAIAYGKKLLPFLEYYEDPCKGQNEMAELGRHVPIPRATNMCTVSFDDIPSAIRKGSEDIILADHHLWGGMEATMQLGKICEVFGRKLSMHSNSHMGVSLMAMAHLGASLPNLAYAIDTHYPWQKEEIVEGGRIRFDDGAVVIGHEPGLGVEIDHKELERLHKVYLACGIRDRNDEMEMQKVVPGWTFKDHVF